MASKKTANTSTKDLQGKSKILTTGSSQIEVDEKAIEPKDYFKILKSKLKVQDKKALETSLAQFAGLILDAKKNGQQALLDKLAFTYTVITKELELYACGFTKYVNGEDIEKFIDEVTPRNSIKIIELDRYQRVIPKKVSDKLQLVKDKGIFDGFVVVFTDFSNDKMESKKDKDFVKRNRDPIIFGFFTMPITHVRHERFYFIADWVDKDCDLTFDKMIKKMVDMGIKNPEKVVAVSPDAVREIITNTLKDLEKYDKRSNEIEPKSFWQRFRAVIGL